MKATVFVSFLMAVTNAAAFITLKMLEDPCSPFQLPNILEKEMFRNMAEYVREHLREEDPVEVPLQTEFTVQDGLIVKLKNITASQTIDFTVNSIECGKPEVWVKFDVTFPKLPLEGGFELDGEVDSERINEQGIFSAYIEDLGLKGHILAKIDDDQVSVGSIYFDFDLKDEDFFISFSLNGTPEKQTKILHLLNTLPVNDHVRKMQKEWAATIAGRIRGQTNRIFARFWLENKAKG